MPVQSIVLQAKFIVESPHVIHHPGFIEVRHGRVVGVGTRRRANYSPHSSECIDLGDRVLLPGLVNAHTHLEFSSLSTPIPAGNTFPDWIGAVVRARAEAAQQFTFDQLLTQHRVAIERGLQECWNSGTAAICDIATAPWGLEYRWSAHRHATLQTASTDGGASGVAARHLASCFAPRVIALCEVLGLTVERLQQTIAWAEQLLGDWTSQCGQRLPDAAADEPGEGAVADNLLTSIGVSPHAPYSILWEPVWLGRISKLMAGRVVAMHVAESREELEYIGQRKGPFVEAWKRLGLPVDNATPTIDQVIDWIAETSKYGLIVHGNYLSAAEMERIARYRTLSVVFCPRTHCHFGHQPYPLAQLHDIGVRVTLGTDSRASNPDLNLWQEAVTCWRLFPQLSPQWIFAAVTSQPAAALGIDHEFGTLSPGRQAFINVVDAKPHWTCNNLLQALIGEVQCLRPLAALWA